MTENARVLLVTRGIVLKEDKVLLVKRAPDDRHNPDLWEFPGGKVDAGETVQEGLVREVFEETGLTVEPSSPFVYVENEIIQSYRYYDKLYLALFHAVRPLSGDFKISTEHALFVWDTFEEAAERELTNETRNALAAFALYLHKD